MDFNKTMKIGKTKFWHYQTAFRNSAPHHRWCMDEQNACSAVSLANHLRAVADGFRPLRIHQRYLATER